MTPEEQAEVERLCRLIQVEKDQEILLKLTEQLNALLERAENKLKNRRDEKKAC